jgi:hypothetical protein
MVRFMVRWWTIVLGLGLGLGLAGASGASAAVAPLALTLDQSAGTQAGTSVALGSSITFGSSSLLGADSVKDLTLTMPPGLLADASIDNGVCLSTAPAASESAMPAACKVGTGQVSTAAVTLNISLYLVAPPASGDLAGLAVYSDFGGAQLGDTGTVSVRPADAGLTIALTNIPNSFSGIPLTVTKLQTTLSAERLPTRCPTSPADYVVSATGYDGSTGQTSAPLTVTGCPALSFAGSALSVTAARDAADGGTAVTTDITQPAAAGQATSGTSVLRLPADVLAPNAVAVLTGGILCADPSSGTCPPVGTATTTSPLYPRPLTGRAYLTGSLASQSLTLVFPPPFAFTLTGKVTLPSAGENTITTTFAGLPDLPLTRLEVALSGGPNALFVATCAPASGTASSALTSQDGEVTASLSAPVTVAGCPPTGTPTPASGPSTPSNSTSGGGRVAPPKPGAPRVLGAAFNGLRRGHPVLRLRVRAGRHAPLLASVTVALPGGIRATRRHVRVTASGARVRSVRIVHGRLLITFRRRTGAVRFVVRGLAEGPWLRTKARRKRVHRLRLVVVATDLARHATRLPFTVTHLGL